MAQADHAYTTSRFHNLSNAALADAVGHRRAAHLGFYLSASFLCRKPQFNEPPEGLRPRRQVFLLPAPSVDALNHRSL